jgi:hypothetical protein
MHVIDDFDLGCRDQPLGSGEPADANH